MSNTLTLILSCTPNLEKLKEIDGNVNKTVEKTLKSCLNYSIEPASESDSTTVLKIESVIDFLNDEINTGHWYEVPLTLRQCFTCASFVKCLILLKNGQDSIEVLQKCLHSLDMGILLGSPIKSNSYLLTNTASLISCKILELQPVKDAAQVSVKRNKRDLQSELESFENLPGKIIDTVKCPSLEYFNKKYFSTGIPVKLKGCMNHWPAVKRWLDVNYLLNIAGDRMVPIEIGSHYADEKWFQKLMPLKEFISKYYLSDSGDVGYLAQHNLFEQINELKADIYVPEYCCLSLNDENDASEPDVNAWFGPKGTVSPLHQDPKNNILAQVYGTKQLILFSPDDTQYVYPHEEKLLNNTAQVDPIKPDLLRHVNFPKAKAYKCLLEAGDMLFIPVKWWHHVTALEKSFSVSFWWE